MLRETPEIQLDLAVTGMHCDNAYGNTIHIIEQDNFNIIKVVDININTTSHTHILHSMSVCLNSFGDFFSNNTYDAVMVLGDRYEIFSVAIAASMHNIPLIHIHGGEKTLANYDEFIRHSITKMSKLHLTSTEEYKKRVIQLGEKPGSVFNIGSLGAENALSLHLPNKQELELKYGSLLKRYFVVVFHPETLSTQSVNDQIDELLSAISFFKNTHDFIFIGSNADTGSDIIQRKVKYFCKEYKFRYLISIRSEDYLAMIKYSCGLIGNSSSGLIEVPSLKVATINIGDRQKGRVRGASVIDVPVEKNAIVRGINISQDEKFISVVQSSSNPYFKENALINAVRIILNQKIKITKIFMTSRNVPPVMTRKKVLCFVFRYDSHFLALKNIFEQIDVDSYDLFFCCLDNSLQEFVKKNLDEKIVVFYPDDFVCFFTFINIEFIFCSTGGKDLHEIVNTVRTKDTIIISCFPGIVLTSQIEAFISKSNSHYLLINSPKDIKTYKKICKIIGVPFNGILFGPPWIKNVNINAKSENSCLIVDQVNEPLTPIKRIEYARFLIRVIQKHPHMNFIFKTRNPLISPDSIVFDIKEYIERFDLKNITFSDDNIDSLISKVEYCITISSSVAIYCLANKIKVYLINGFNHTCNGQCYFSRSGLIVDYNKFNFKHIPRIKKKWMEENFYYSRDIQHKILNDILKMPPNVNVRTFGIKRSTLIILFLIFFNFFFSLGPKKIKTLKKIHKVLLRYKKDDI